MLPTAPPIELLSSFANFLIASQVLTETDMRRHIKSAERNETPLLSYLVMHHLVDSKKVATEAAIKFGYPFMDLEAFDLSKIPISLLNERLIRKHNVLPLYVRGKTIFVGLSNPLQQLALDEIKFHTQLNPKIIIVEEHKLAKAIESALETTDTSMEQLLEDHFEQYDNLTNYVAIAEDNSEIDDAPIVKFVNKVLSDAVKQGVSDIHLEPYENSFRIRFRNDGLLHQVANPPLTIANRIISRLKVMAKMDISEHRIPQDGRIKITLGLASSIDCRVNCCPTLFGEKMVLRILDPNNAQIGIKHLGFDAEQEQLFTAAINKPYGMILVTGPTGSGKTVTLYTALNILNNIERNICTAEDPVEITVEGINQLNVNVKTGLTFATALRAFLRQDPDIIMLGEIRDFETADIAVKAAQTGHLVLSTLHTNDAPQTLNRLLQMGIEPYNIASSIILIMAQRLVRCLCPICKKRIQYPTTTLISTGFNVDEIESLQLYGPVGCASCNAGYKNRIGIFQIMPLSDTLRNLILEKGNAEQITNLTESEGINNLHEAGLNKVRMGITSLEELDRVTKE